DSLGVDVCSTSLGYIDFDMEQWNHPFEHYDGHTAPMSIGCEIAASRGMICMNAAGNEGDGTCTLGIPADAEHIVTVGAVDANGERAYFSSVGPTYDGRIKPDVMAMGQDTYVASGYGSYWPYYNGSGTSFATPVLAGAVACLRQALPYASVQEICDALRACGNRAENPDNYYGYGIPDFSQALEVLSVNEPIGNTPTHIILHKADLTVFDFMGRKLYSYSFNGLNHTTFERYLNTLESGVYFINAVSESGSETLKLVLTK
ncbi:MAG: peptidase, S8/S53 family, partial [bacterium F083]